MVNAGGKPKVYDIVKDRLIDALQHNTVPWQKGWRGGASAPRNMKTWNDYNGINILLLNGSPLWGTYKQIQELGGNVRRGEKASGISVFWTNVSKKKEIDEDTGEKVTVTSKLLFPVARYTSVFSIDQCEGLDHILEKYDEEMTFEQKDPIAMCEDIVTYNNPVITRGEPAYQPRNDCITMPSINQFDSSEEYYATLFHELTHWTGHKDRLNRKGIVEFDKFGSEQYANEELIAEIGSAFLINDCGLDSDIVFTNSVAYIKGWLKYIKESSSKDVVRTAMDAQKAVNFIYEH